MIRAIAVWATAIGLLLIGFGTESATAQGGGSHIQKVANQRLGGTSYARFPNLAYEQCEARCLSDPQCVALEHFRGGGRVFGRTAQCKLFSQAGDARANNYADVGYRRPGGAKRDAIAEVAKKKAEEERKAAEAKKKTEDGRLADDERKAADARLAEDARKAEEERKSTETRKKAEDGRLADDQRRAADAKLAQDARKAAEVASEAAQKQALSKRDKPTAAAPQPAPVTAAPPPPPAVTPPMAAPTAPPTKNARARGIIRPSDEPASGGASAGGAAPASDWDVVPVFYGTDRNRRDSSKRIAYGSDRARRLELGRALITVPKAHQVPNVERPWAIKLPYLDVTIYQESRGPEEALHHPGAEGVVEGAVAAR